MTHACVPFLWTTPLWRILVRPALSLLLCLGWGEVWAADLPPVEVQPWGRLQHLLPAVGGRDGFVLMNPGVTGIGFTNHLSMDRALTNQIFLNGSGVAAGDVDGDGWCDLYFCGLDNGNVLYRNLGGWKFEDVTGVAGVACEGQASTGCALADVDGDGDLDLLVNGVAAGTRLFLNDGKGRFQEFTDAGGLRGDDGSTSMALADVDGDGDLDLYVVNYRNDTMRDMPDLQFNVKITNGVYQLLEVNGESATHAHWAGRFSFDKASGILENGQPDVLWRNRGSGRFEKVPWNGGGFLDEHGQAVPPPMDWGLSAQFHDLNGDGFPDLYVCNDFHSPDRIWMNDGRGIFRAIARSSIRQTSLFSMGVDVADVNRDGNVDLFVADMLSPEHERRLVQVMDATAFAQSRSVRLERPQSARNTLLLGRGRGVFDEIAQMSGLEASDWSWCPVFLDVDLDGYEDLLVTTGHARDAQNMDTIQEMEQRKRRGGLSKREELELRRMFAPLRTPNAAFRNLHDLRFEQVSAAWGFDADAISHGMAVADLDRDGDLDVVVNVLNGGALVYRNQTLKPRVLVRLRGAGANTRGIGARVRLQVERREGMSWPEQSQEIIAAGRYLSCDAAERMFAMPENAGSASLEIQWRSGLRSVVTGVRAGECYEVDEKSAAVGVAMATLKSGRKPRFWGDEPLLEEVSRDWAPVHEDQAASDLSLQPLVPHGTLAHGPSVCWTDLNGDGWPDFSLSAGQGGRFAVYRNNAQGGFIRQKSRLFELPLEQTMIGALGVGVSESEQVLFQVFGARRGAGAKPAFLRMLSLATAESRDWVLPSDCNPGSVAWGDVDGDGDLDFVLGARSPDGRFPARGGSMLYVNEGGRWVASSDAAVTNMLSKLGPVNDLAIAHLSGTAVPEWVVAQEWGPVRILQKQGRGTNWADWNPIIEGLPGFEGRAVALSEATGWWTSLAVGDWDGDGLLDLMVGNWGRNHRRNRFLSQPLELYVGDVSGSGVLALLEGVRESKGGGLVPLQDLAALQSSFPMLQERFQTFGSFAAAGLERILSEGMPVLEKRSAAVLESGVLLQRGGGQPWKWISLPWEAQVAPVQGIGVADLDGDGHLDVVLAQNFHDVAPGESRLDAGRGLVLLGTGHGSFEALTLWESGVEVEGEGRGVALADMNRDGRPDVAISQYRGQLKVYRNRGGRENLSVVLKAGGMNPWGVGARVRGQYGDGTWGPVSEVVIGTGQQSGCMGEWWVARERGGAALKVVEVIWGDGFQQEYPVKGDGRRVELKRGQ